MIEHRGEKFVVVVDEDAQLCTCSWFPDTVVTAHDAREALAAESRLIAGRGYGLLVRLAGIRTMQREARLVFAAATTADTGIPAMVLIAQSPVQRIIGNFFIGVRRAKVPVRMFTDEAAGRAWLHAELGVRDALPE